MINTKLIIGLAIPIVGGGLKILSDKLSGKKERNFISKEEIVKRLKKNPEYYFMLKEEYSGVPDSIWRDAVSEVGIEKINEAVIQSSLNSFELR